MCLEYRAIGTQDYRGLKLSFSVVRRGGLSLGGNFTVSHCETDTPVTGNFVQFQNTWLKPGDPSYDRGNCPYNQRLISNWTAGYLTPRVLQRCAAHRCLRLARLGHRHRELRQLADGDHHLGSGVQRHPEPACESGERRRVWRQVADELSQRGGVRISGGRHAGGSRAQEHRRSWILEDRHVRGTSAAAGATSTRSNSASRRST